jgi:hypothetical protein
MWNFSDCFFFFDPFTLGFLGDLTACGAIYYVQLGSYRQIASENITIWVIYDKNVKKTQFQQNKSVQSVQNAGENMVSY